MNSRNMPDEEELDHMFRQAADSFEPEFDPEAWRQMEQKLDKVNRPPAALGNWTRRIVLALLLLVSGIVVFHFASRETNPVSVEDKTLRKDTPALASTPEQITPDKTASGKQKPLIVEKKAGHASTTLPAAREQTDQPTRLLRRSKARPARSSRRVSSAVQLSKQTESNKLVPPEVGNTELAKANKNLKNGFVPGQDSTLEAVSSEVPASAEPALTPGSQNSSVDSTTEHAELKEAIAESRIVSVDSAQAKKVVMADSVLKKVPVTFMSKVGISLVFGPDFSTVKFVRPEKASTNVGVLLSYAINKRWTVAAGVVRAKKVYGAKPADYHMKPGYWGTGRLPDEINAVCKVVDIPLNVRYAVVALPRHTIYVQTGLSSYLMLHEDYRYDYNYYSKHWIAPEQNRHFFQVLNLSVGYSKQIKPGISVGAEPFAKIPLAGIGAGKVNLASFGAFFSVSYRFR